LAPKNIHTTRNPYPEPTTSVADTEKLLHKRKEKESHSGIFLDVISSLTKDEVRTIDDFEFDIKFE
jgi:hypothetical protein